MAKTHSIRVMMWLDDHGGRNTADVLEDEEGFHVMMGDGRGGYMKKYLPGEKGDKVVEKD